MRQDVEHIQLKALIVEHQVLMLRMDVYQPVAQLLHQAELYRSIVDERTTFSRGIDLATQNAIAVVVNLMLFEEHLQRHAGDIELCLNHTFRGSLANGFAIGSLSQQQGQGTQHNRFAGTSLASNHREARLERDVELIYQCIVLYMKGTNHLFIISRTRMRVNAALVFKVKSLFIIQA